MGPLKPVRLVAGFVCPDFDITHGGHSMTKQSTSFTLLKTAILIIIAVFLLSAISVQAYNAVELQARP